MKSPKQYLLVSDTGRGPSVLLTQIEPAPELFLRTPEFQPGRAPLRLRPLLPPREPAFTRADRRIHFVPLESRHDYAFWAAGKIRLRLALPQPRRPERCLPLIACYEHAQSDPPLAEEVDRVIELLRPRIPPQDTGAFGLQAAILRAASRAYFSGW